MIGYDGYPGARAATFDATYLIQCDIETVAVVDNKTAIAVSGVRLVIHRHSKLIAGCGSSLQSIREIPSLTRMFFPIRTISQDCRLRILPSATYAMIRLQ